MCEAGAGKAPPQLEPLDTKTARVCLTVQASRRGYRRRQAGGIGDSRQSNRLRHVLKLELQQAGSQLSASRNPVFDWRLKNEREGEQGRGAADLRQEVLNKGLPEEGN